MRGTLLLIFTLISTLGLSQETPKDKREKIEQLKIAFITKELDLTTEQSEKFWPLYHEMETKFRDIKRERKKLNDELRTNFDSLSDQEVKTKVNTILDGELREVELKKEYNKKFADIIGYKKAAKLLSLEQRFKRELLNRVNQPGPPKGPQR